MHNFKDILFIGLLILSSTYAVEYNIALNKTVFVSYYDSDHPPALAIDQDLNTYVVTYYFKNLGTWIQFDLKGVYNITKIIIWPTNDEADYITARVTSFVRLTKSTDFDSYDFNDVFCTYSNPVKGSRFICSRNNVAVKGRYVLLIKDQNLFSMETIRFAEVAILTEDTDFVLAITGQVEQSHVLDNNPIYKASLAVDESIYTCINTAQEKVENQNIQGWWRTDLGETHQVLAVNINDYRADQRYRGYYSVYVDNDVFTKQQLCSTFNQNSTQFTSFFQLKCNSVLTGRYLTVERINSADRPDSLNFCEIQVVARHKDSIYTLPKNYNNSLTTTPFMTPTSSNIITTSITSPISTSTSDTGLENATDCQQKVQHQNQVQLLEKDKVINSSQTDKIIIGVVVGSISAILFAILGFVSGYFCHKKRSLKPSESNAYEATKEENMNQPVYSDVDNTPMNEICAYYNENK